VRRVGNVAHMGGVAGVMPVVAPAVFPPIHFAFFPGSQGCLRCARGLLLNEIALFVPAFIACIENKTNKNIQNRYFFVALSEHLS
jgi:hypothetical protein